MAFLEHPDELNSWLDSQTLGLLKNDWKGNKLNLVEKSENDSFLSDDNHSREQESTERSSCYKKGPIEQLYNQEPFEKSNKLSSQKLPSKKLIKN